MLMATSRPSPAATSSRGTRESTTACCSGRCFGSPVRTSRSSRTSAAGSGSPATNARASRHASAPPWADFRPAWPCPAGGMTFAQLPGMCADYGPDAVLLIGGALIGHGEDLEASTRTYLDIIRETSQERLEPPAPPRDHPFDARGPRVLAHRAGFEWSGRPSSAYKDAPGSREGPGVQGRAQGRAGREVRRGLAHGPALLRDRARADTQASRSTCTPTS